MENLFRVLATRLWLILAIVSASAYTQDLKSNWRVVEEELLDCVIEDNSCVPYDGESGGDSRNCCSGVEDSRHICRALE